MKSAEVTKLVGEGALLCHLEYRNFKVDEKLITSKKTGRKEAKLIVTHSCEGLSGQPIIIEQWLDDGIGKESVKPAHKKGDRVILRVSEFKRDGAAWRARGELHTFEN